MDEKLKADWVKALRSGEYVQGIRRLRKDGAHCCLGVLCEVAGLEINDVGNGIVGVPALTDDYGPIYELLGSSAAAEGLWNRNDGLRGKHKHSFAEIADYIEQVL